MDDMDRVLRALPQEAVSPTLASTIRAMVHRRHHRRRTARRGVAAALAVLGLWLMWPGLIWLSSGEIYAPGTSWLFGGLDFLSYESVDALNRLWSSAFSVQNAIASSLAVAIWVGAILLSCAIFLLLEGAAWQPPSNRGGRGANSGMLVSSLDVHT